MIANVKIYLNDQVVSQHDVEIADEETLESPNVVIQINQVFGEDTWDRLEIS